MAAFLLYAEDRESEVAWKLLYKNHRYGTILKVPHTTITT